MPAKSNVVAIKDYFGTADKPVTMTELKALSKEDRAELAEQVFAVTGWDRATS